jgi:site-specific DNA-methyltransferase (adenine-specific)
MCISDHGIKPNMVVLDPFMGIGTTGVACQNLGVNFIGFEIDTGYIQIANKFLGDAPL